MKVDKVRDVTTQESPITHEITLRVNVWDCRDVTRSSFSEALTNSVVNAINGLGDYPITFKEIQDAQQKSQSPEHASQG